MFKIFHRAYWRSIVDAFWAGVAEGADEARRPDNTVPRRGGWREL